VANIARVKFDDANAENCEGNAEKADSTLNVGVIGVKISHGLDVPQGDVDGDTRSNGETNGSVHSESGTVLWHDDDAGRRRVSFDDTNNMATIQSAAGTVCGVWKYSDKQYAISGSGPTYLFHERIKQGVLKGELIPTGEWYLAELRVDSQMVGFIRLRTVTDGIESQFKAHVSINFSPPIVARRQLPGDEPWNSGSLVAPEGSAAIQMIEASS